MPNRTSKRGVRRLFAFPQWLTGSLFGPARSWARDSFRRLRIEPLECRRVLTSLSGYVFHDVNNDGTLDVGDGGIPNVTVTLTGTDDVLGSVTMTTVTNASGAYSFALGSGTYKITVGDPAGYVGSVASIGSQGAGINGYDSNDLYIDQIILPDGVDGTNNDFGELATAQVAGTVWSDANNDGVKETSEAPIAGATLQLSGTDDRANDVESSTTTSPLGAYSFPGLRPGTYTITVNQPAGYLPGKIVAGSELAVAATQPTLAGGQGQILCTLDPGDIGAGNNFAELLPASLSGYAWNETSNNNGVKTSGEPVISGVTVTLTGNSDLGPITSTSAVTNSSGLYTFSNLRPGVYALTESQQPAGYTAGKDAVGSQNGTLGNGQITNIALSAGITGTNNNFGETNQPPTVATPAAASPSPVTGTTCNLSVLGADDGGASNLTYTWAATGTPPAAVSFSVNGTNAAKNTTANFSKAGSYSFQVTIADQAGATVTSSVNVTVSQKLTTIAVSPASVNLNVAAQQQFTATAKDQFGTALSTQPTFTWAASAGTINSSGLLTAPNTSVSNGTVTAGAPSGSGGVSGAAAFTVTVQPPTVKAPASAAPNPATGTTTNLTVLGADAAGESTLTYTWAVTGTPPAAVNFSINGSNAAKNTTATFSKAGIYSFQATITDQGGLSVTSNVNVTVNQTFAAIVVAPASSTLRTGATLQFSASANDQFGAPLAAQPTFVWTSTAGTISVGGLLTAPGTAVNSATVTAGSGGLFGSAGFTVKAPPTVATPASASPNPVTGTTTNLSVLGADPAGESTLTYTWAATGTPPAAVIFSANGTNAAKNSTVTFSKAGSYTIQVTITDANGFTATSSVTVTVNQTLTAITVAPASINLGDAAQQQFTAMATDQFGATLATQPSFTWTTSAGTITAGGVLTTPNTAVNSGTVTAGSGSVKGTASFTVAVQPPTVAVAASATPNPVTGTTSNLSVLGADVAGESNLTYAWAVTGTPPAAVTFSVNGSNSAKNSTATFSKAGNYTFQVTITNPGGLTATSSVNVIVNQTFSAVAVAPASVALHDASMQQFTATAEDQFGAALAAQPSFNWATNAGTISASGLLTAPNTTVNNGTVTAGAPSGSGGVNGTATFTVAVQPPTVAAAASASPNPVPGTTCNLSVLGADVAGESNLIYGWTLTGTPPAAVTFSANGSNAAKNTTATFSKAGVYTFQVTITDPGGLTATSSVNVTVNQTLTSITVAPASINLNDGAQQQFTATAKDQFGATLASQPSFTWTSTAGTISATGLLTAPDTAVNSGTVTAGSGGVNGTAAFTVAVQPPTVAVAASASPNPTTTTTTNLSVLGADVAGESNLIYGWALTGTPPAAVTFGANGSNAAKNTTATFSKAGAYTFQVTITNPGGLTVTSSVNVTVNQTLTAIVVAPTPVSLHDAAVQQFSAAAEDQFGLALAAQPSFTWAASAGTISPSGLLTAPNTAVNNGTVTASSGGLNGSAAFTVSVLPPTVAVAASATPNPVAGTTTNLSVLGADNAGASNLTYVWTTTGTPPAAVNFSANGNNAAQNTTATFSKAGNYSFQVTITNPGGLSVTSSVNVTVNQTLTAIAVAPASINLNDAALQQFTATAKDQFGAALVLQPSFTWAASAGMISTTGLLTAPVMSVNNGIVVAASGGVSGSAAFTVTVQPPTVAVAASASPNPVTGTTCTLSTLGADDAGESNLTYTWAATGTPPAAVNFSVNGSNAAKNTTATFSKAGSYSFQVALTNSNGLTATSSVNVIVNQTLTSISVAPASINSHAGAADQFTATADDQFGAAMAVQPSFTWTASAGTISTSGLLTAPDISVNNGIVTAGAPSGSGGVSGTAAFTVTNLPPTIAVAASASPNPVTGTTCNLSALGADDAGESNLTYTWAATGTPPAAVNFSANGTNAAKNTTATFSKAGNYTFQVTITDAGGLTATSSVNVTVNQTLTAVVVGPASINLNAAAVQQFTATAEDQFGAAMAGQPSFTWAASAGTISGSGLLTAPNTAVNSGNVTASAAGISGSAAFTVTIRPPTVAVAASASPNPTTTTTTNLSALGSDDAGESNLTYTWLVLGTPAGTVSFSANGTNAAKNTTVTFTKAGNYSFQVTITDPGGLAATSSVNVAVNQAFTAITVAPASLNLIDGAVQQFTATADDQFGAPLTVQPSFTWATNAGTISTGGLLTAPATAVDNGTVTASSGGINGSAAFTVTVQPPTVAVTASATPNPVLGTTCSLSVLGADDAGESNLTYTWAATGTPPAAVSFSANGSNAAKNTTATFSKAGNYSFQVTLTNAAGLTATSSVNVTVNQTFTTIAVAPASINLHTGNGQQFTATADDQFGAALAAQPTFTWTASAGTITANGLLTAPNVSVNNGTVTASSGGLSGSATFTVNDQAPTIAVAASATPNPVPGTTTNLSALGADNAGEANLTYTWTVSGTPPAGVNFSVNGTNGAKNTTATFTKAGIYSFLVTITNANSLSATSSVNVTVNQTLTAITVAPASVNLIDGSTQQFSATAQDQFGANFTLPPSFTWAASAGTISASGLLTAPVTAVSGGTVTASSGGVSGTAAFTVTAQPPTVAVAASASPNPVPGTTCNLSALGADSAGEANLTYTWAVTGTPPAAVTFSANGTNAAKNTLATFSKAGSYPFQVTITDPSGLTATSSVNVTVNQTLTAVTVSPASIHLNDAAQQQFTATADDQFGAALAVQPSFTWTANAGTITATGLLTAPNTAVNNGIVTAGAPFGSGGVSGSAAFTVTVQPPTVSVAASATPNPVTGTTCNLSALGADNAGASNLTYTWAATGTPPAAVSFSANGSNAAQNSTVTFTQAGNYVFQVTITDPAGLTATSSVNVTVNQTLTSIAIAPASVNLHAGALQQFTATAEDQFAAPLAVQPSFTWAASAGTISTSGLLTAPDTSATGTVTAGSAGVSGSASFADVNLPPTIAVAASASPNPVTGTTCNLSALGADDAGESNLTYTWIAIGTPPAAVTYSANGSNAAKSTTATFSKAGNYSFQVTVTDAGGLTATSSVNVTVNQTLTAIAVAPATVNLNDAAQQQFTATADDQFGAPLATQPGFTWTASAGTISTSGLLTAPNTTVSNGTVTASSGSVSGTAAFTVSVLPPTVAVAASATPNPVTATTTNLSVLGADNAGAANLTYTWDATGTPPATVTYSANGSNAAKNTTATFSKAGNYTFQVTITNPGGLTATSSVNVTVNQTLTAIAVTPASNHLNDGAQQQFTATAEDQFGAPLAAQPSFTWTASAGTISSSGLLTAPLTAVTSGTVSAASGGLNGSASFTVTVLPPTIAVAASASPNPLLGTVCTLTALGADSAGESNLTYTWAVTGTPPAAVHFGGNGNNAAKNTTATFTKAGSYTLQVTVANPGGLTATSSVVVVVNQKLTMIVVSPATVNLNDGAQQQFTATADDQFGAPLATQPGFTWTASAGSITAGGLLTAPDTAVASGGVTAASGGVSGSGAFTVTVQPPTVAVTASASPNPVPGTTTNLSALGADDAGASNLTYTWAATGTPPAAVNFSVNGTNAAQNTTATFSQAGNYSFQVTITNAAGLTATSGVIVTVNQTLTTINVTPGSASLHSGAVQPYTATADDQFGAALAVQPTFTWTTSAGTIGPSGLLRAPFTAVTNGMVSAASSGVSGSATFMVTVQSAAVAVPASATPNPVTGTTTNLSVLGADDTGESNLTYTWATTGTPPATVTFSSNGTNASKNSTATFGKAGNYSFQVTITNPGGMTATSSVNVTVNQTLTAIAVSPPSSNLNDAAQQQYTAVAQDQFGAALATQPSFTWTTSAGTISTSGLLTAPVTSVNNGHVTAASGGVSGAAAFTVTVQPPTVATPASASPNPVTGTTANLSVLGADDAGEPNLTYTWTTTGTQPGPVSFGANGTNAAKNTTVTFGKAGNYSFQVTVTNPGGLTTTSSVSVAVNQTLTAISVTPASANLSTGGSQQFTATADDQFGAAFATQPSFTWTTSAGTISTSGLLAAPGTTVTSGTVTASSGGLSGSAAFTVSVPSSSLSGYVYYDANYNYALQTGQRQISAGVYHPGIPNVAITLESANFPAETVLTQTDGSYQFNSLPAGDYTLVETQPPQYLSVLDVQAGSFGGNASVADTISNINALAGQNGTEYNFGEWLVAQGNLSKRIALASTPTAQNLVFQQAVTPPPTVQLGASSTNNTTSTVGGSPVYIAPSATISYFGGMLTSLTVTIANLKNGASEALVIPGQTIGTVTQPVALGGQFSSKITTAYSPAAGALTLSGFDSVSDYQSVLRAIQYENTAASPDTSPRIINVVALNGLSASSTATVTVTYPPAPVAAAKVQASVVSKTPAVFKSPAIAKGPAPSVATSISTKPSNANLVDHALASMYSLLGR
jgi:hypothetical protein